VDRISAAAIEIVYRSSNGSNASETDELDILVADFTRGVFMRGVPVKTLSDCSTELSDPSSPSSLRRRILVFRELTANQRLELQSFIQNYAW
jgi:hypothetical protein